MTENQNHTLLFVDDEVNILHSLQRLFRREGYNILTASSGKDGLEVVGENEVSLIISDNRMPVMEGVEFLSKVKEVSPDTVRFMLTGYSDIKAVMAAINSGEVSRYITKPWDDDSLKLTVKEALERYDLKKKNLELSELTQKQNAELVELNQGLEAKVLEKTKKIRDNFFAFVRIFTDILELHDPYTGGHCKRVASMAKKLAVAMKLDETDIDLVESAALLHSIGLIGVPKTILEKDEETLKENEKEVLRHSPVLAQGLLSSIDFLRQVGVLIRSHNERYDGGGYPDGLKHEEIHIGSRIIAVCKLYDRLVTRKERPFRKNDAIEFLRRESGKAFDPNVADSFVDFIKGWKEDHISTRVPVADIKVGTILAKNLVTARGRLLVTRGTHLTTEIIKKIHSFNDIDPIVEGAHIISE